jgi:hypothetical protein
MIGCSQNDAELYGSTDEQKNSIDEPKISPEERKMMNIIINGKYIKVENDQYVIHLSEKEAVRLGISKEFYRLTVDLLEKSNAIIKEGLEREKTDSTFSIYYPGS